MATANTVIAATVFEGEVIRAFGPLMDRFGFTRTRGNGYTVRFEKQAVFVEVSYDAQRSRELTVWIGERQHAEPPLELADALRATGCPDAQLETVALMQTSDPAVLSRLLNRAARLIEENGEIFLRAEDAAFQRARAIRSSRAREYTADVRIKGDLAAAEAAWQERDYRKVYALLAPLRDELDEKHRRRLEFAERQR